MDLAACTHTHTYTYTYIHKYVDPTSSAMIYDLAMHIHRYICMFIF
jgi:hypothetical protein